MSDPSTEGEKEGISLIPRTLYIFSAIPDTPFRKIIYQKSLTIGEAEYAKARTSLSVYQYLVDLSVSP